MVYTVKCTCSLGFYGAPRHNYKRKDIELYGDPHQKKFKFIIVNPYELLTTLVIRRNNKIQLVHEGKPIYRQLRGEEQRRVQSKLQHRRVADYIKKLKKETNPEIMLDGHIQNLRTYKTLYKAK